MNIGMIMDENYELSLSGSFKGICRPKVEKNLSQKYFYDFLQ